MEWLVLYRGETLATAEVVSQSADPALLKVVQAYLTVHAPEDLMRHCPACQTLFVGSGKQRYCSRTCVNRVTSRRWRENAAHRATDNRRSRARYAARTAARNGEGG